jgi:hypothetical protein
MREKINLCEYHFKNALIMRVLCEYIIIDYILISLVYIYAKLKYL